MKLSAITAPKAADVTPAEPANHEQFLRSLAGSSDPVAARARVAELTTTLIERTGTGMALADADLAGLDLSGFDLRKACLNRVRLHGTRLRGANLEGASLVCPGMERTDCAGASFAGAYVHAWSAQVCSFAGADMRDLVDATGALFHGCNLRGARLDRSTLAGTTFYQCDMEQARLAAANLQGCMINECVLDGASLSGAGVSQLVITKSRMQGMTAAGASGVGMVVQRPTAADGLDLTGAELPSLRMSAVRGSDIRARGLLAPGADFTQCFLASLDLELANLSQARFTSCVLDGANFRAAKLDCASFLETSLREANFEGVQAENMHAVESSFVEAAMRRFSARCATFRDCDLSRVDLSDAYLYRAMITGDPPRAMSLRRAVLSNANLVQAYLTADLRAASLRGANLTYARLNQSVLEDADLDGALLYGASMIKTDFTRASVAGLEAPFFSDRCSGLSDALRAHNCDETQRFVERVEALVRSAKRSGST